MLNVDSPEFQDAKVVFGFLFDQQGQVSEDEAAQIGNEFASAVSADYTYDQFAQAALRTLERGADKTGTKVDDAVVNGLQIIYDAFSNGDTGFFKDLFDWHKGRKGIRKAEREDEK